MFALIPGHLMKVFLPKQHFYQWIQLILQQQPQRPPEHSLESSKMSDDQVKTIVSINNFDIASYRQRIKGLDTPDICTLIKNFLDHTKIMFFLA